MPDRMPEGNANKMSCGDRSRQSNLKASCYLHFLLINMSRSFAKRKKLKVGAPFCDLSLISLTLR